MLLDDSYGIYQHFVSADIKRLDGEYFKLGNVRLYRPSLRLFDSFSL